MSTPETVNTPDADSTDPQEIEADIARHRTELGRTVDELSDRLDVKKQAKQQVKQARAVAQDAVTSAADQAKTLANSVEDRAKEFKAQARQASPGEFAAMIAPAAGIAAGAVLAIVLTRRQRR